MNNDIHKFPHNKLAPATIFKRSKSRMHGALDKQRMLRKPNTASASCVRVTKAKQTQNFDFAGIAG